MDIPPRMTRRKRELTEIYTMTMTKEMKDRLVELKLFDNVDVPKWIRSMIAEGLKKIDEQCLKDKL